MELSKTAYVILGMIALGKRTGYEIKSLVDVSTRFFWAASYGQIYPELGRLEELGLITGEADLSDGRKRRAYELTAAGKETLREWLTSSEPLHMELRHEGALKFFFSGALPEDERTTALRQMRAEHERMLEQLRAFQHIKPARDDGELSFPSMTLEWGIAYQEFMIDWCSRTERQLRVSEPAGRET